VGLLVVLVAAALVAVALARAARGRRRRAAPAAPGAEVAAPPPGPPRGVAGWRAELERRLAAGDVAGALEALWWWLARALAGEGADESWTGRELVARSRRRDLLPLVARLDAMAYGPERPEPEAVRRLADGFDARLPGAAA
jgi:hypothetical protein